MTEAEALSRALVDALVAAGVSTCVLAPGSRSAPLALALHAAEVAGRLRLHVRVDERGAGFLALGLARAGGGPVAVLTTSGTAVANLHPAVLEAWHSHLPLVVLSADRPGSLTWTGANQTTHQPGMFATHVRAAGVLSDARDDARACAFEVARLVAAATGVRSRLPGPVHLDVELSEPLVSGGLSEPLVSGGLGEPDHDADAGAGTQVPVVAPSRPAPPTPLPAGPRTVLLVGDAPLAVGRSALAWAVAAGVPLLAEPSSNARSGPALGTYRLLLGSPLAAEVERVVVVGHPTLSRPVTRLLGRDDVELVVVAEHADWVDPGRRAARVVDAVALPPVAAEARAWAQRWREADRAVRVEVDALLAGQDVLVGPVVAATLLGALGPDDVLVAGSSNPVRDLDLAPVPRDGPTVYANRGLSGIDGLVSTAMGVALAAGRPTHALIGDVTLLHDANALVVGPTETRPDLRVVVANDDGGSIFASLEQGGPAYADAFERLFATPHGLDVAALAAAAGVPHTRVGTAAALAAALARPPQGVELVEVTVDRQGRRALDAALGALGGAVLGSA